MTGIGDIRTSRGYRIRIGLQIEVAAAAERIGEHTYEFMERAIEHELRRARKRHNHGRRFSKTDAMPRRGRRPL